MRGLEWASRGEPWQRPEDAAAMVASANVRVAGAGMTVSGVMSGWLQVRGV